jgi:hypothetical protein
MPSTWKAIWRLSEDPEGENHQYLWQGEVWDGHGNGWGRGRVE